MNSDDWEKSFEMPEITAGFSITEEKPAKLADLIRKYSYIFKHEMRKNAEGTQEHRYVKLKP